MGKELTIPEGKEVKLPKEQIGMENVAGSDLLMPRLKVLQGLSQEVVDEKGRVGEIVNNLTGENYGKSVELIVVYMFKSRVKFKNEDDPNDFDCRSLDAITSFNNEGRLCAECPFKDWGEDENGKPVPPRCSLVYNFPSLLFKDGEISRDAVCLSCMKTAASAAKKLITIFKLGGLNWWDKVVRLESQKIQGEYTYFVPLFSLVRDTTDTEKKIAYSLYSSIAGKKIEVAEQPRE